MDKLKCAKCKKEKLVNEFNKSSKNSSGYQTRCRSCNCETLKSHYEKNKSKYREKNQRLRDIKKDWLNDFKSQLKCSNCPESRWWVLDFHHVDSDDKDYNIPDMINRGCGLDKIKKEIDKCIILCSNCHRNHHYQERLNSALV